ncbi:hypothetical protein NQ314_008810 [Rhamnusium bicolor]|uniref:Nuclease HARBI1 n=1 Tax=Rhamnusium bicolor TaxID=1586634 RepID=A0AAV8Y5B9_9CUCU|nr:hypothetical protein NQ314_008810 [Rhamnusium bicolor]
MEALQENRNQNIGSIPLQRYNGISYIHTELNKIILMLVTQLLKNILLKMKKKKKRTIWVRKWINSRETLGASNRLLAEMREEDVNGYKNHLRMIPQIFDELLSKIGSVIQKQNTIPAKVKLEITLRYLAVGYSLYTLSSLYRVGKSTISKFIPEVCNAISIALKDYMRVSKTPL